MSMRVVGPCISLVNCVIIGSFIIKHSHSTQFLFYKANSQGRNSPPQPPWLTHSTGENILSSRFNNDRSKPIIQTTRIRYSSASRWPGTWSHDKRTGSTYLCLHQFCLQRYRCKYLLSFSKSSATHKHLKHAADLFGLRCVSTSDVASAIVYRILSGLSVISTPA